jgi:hypothetical protein
MAVLGTTELVVRGVARDRVVAASSLLHKRVGVTLNTLRVSVEHHLSGKRPSLGNIPLQCPRVTLPLLACRSFAATDTIEAVQVHDGSKDAAVHRMLGLVEGRATKEPNKPFNDFGNEHEEEEDEDECLQDENRVRDPLLGGFLNVDLSVSAEPYRP